VVSWFNKKEIRIMIGGDKGYPPVGGITKYIANLRRLDCGCCAVFDDVVFRYNKCTEHESDPLDSGILTNQHGYFEIRNK
jgi:hypothetical protein